MPATIPCLWFDGQAEQAAEFYTSVFPNSEIVSVTRPGPDRSALVVEFSLDGRRYVALNGGPQFTFTEAVSFQILCADQEEVDHYWDRLTDGGEESRCGWLKDRFGLSWQVVPQALTELLGAADAGSAQRVGQALFEMRRIVIADLERAAAVPA